ncbi:hypothetical protein P4S72_18105 [Vibrio sp. PP-XX7]
MVFKRQIPGRPVYPDQDRRCAQGRVRELCGISDSLFWLEVAKDPELMAQFDPLNKAQVRKGNAPLTIEKNLNGENQKKMLSSPCRSNKSPTRW